MISLLLATAALAANISVCPDGSCDHTSIQAAVDASVAHDIITIGDGTYAEYIEITHQVALIGDFDSSVIVTGDPLQTPREAVITIDQVDDPLLTVRLENMVIFGPDTRAVHILDSRCNMRDVTVRSNALATNGGGLWMQGTELDLQDVVFNGNTASGNGGHIWMGPDSKLVFSGQDTFFLGGTAGSNGGAIFAQGPSTELSMQATGLARSARFEANRAFGNGGAIAIDGDVDVFVDAVFFESNRATRGGAMYLKGNATGGRLTMTRSGFTENEADGEGGAIWAFDADVSIDDTAFDTNNAATAGAVMASLGVELDLLQNRFCGNVAREAEAGAVRWQGIAGGARPDTVWAGNAFVENQAATAPSAVLLNQREMTIENNSFLSNEAFDNGPAVMTQDAHIAFRDNLVAYTRGPALSATTQAGVPTNRTVATYNLFWDNDGTLDGFTIGLDNIDDQPPLLSAYSADGNCDNDDLRQTWESPLKDAGTPDQVDWDNTRRDIGIYGGLFANDQQWQDLDSDGYIDLYDCDRDDASVHPEAQDVPYDGVDTDCGGGSDFDADGDGHDAVGEVEGGTDCDDTDANVYPGAPEVPYNGKIDDCNDRDEASEDQDNDGWTTSARAGLSDCNDVEALIHPGADEIAGDEVDQNCDGFNDPATGLETACSHGPGPLWWWAAVLPLAIRRARDKPAH